jgi:membrane fusion protein, multidrug efflux system
LDVVQKGLQPGDQVVMDGQANLVSGSKIRVKQAPGSRRGNSTASGDSSPAAHSAAKGSSDPSSSSGNDRSGVTGGDRSSPAGSQKSRNRNSGGNQPAKTVGGDS